MGALTALSVPTGFLSAGPWPARPPRPWKVMRSCFAQCWAHGTDSDSRGTWLHGRFGVAGFSQSIVYYYVNGPRRSAFKLRARRKQANSKFANKTKAHHVPDSWASHSDSLSAAPVPAGALQSTCPSDVPGRFQNRVGLADL